MILPKIFNSENSSFEPDFSTINLEKLQVKGYVLNEDGETYTVQAVNKLIALIRKRYSIDDELAIQRQKQEKPEEFQAYFVFVEECKLQINQ